MIVEQSIDLDPLAAAHTMQGGALGDLVRRIEVPPIPTGRQRISVTANLVEPIAGLQALVVDVRVPPLAPFRPLAVAASVSLEPPERRGEVELRLAPRRTARRRGTAARGGREQQRRRARDRRPMADVATSDLLISQTHPSAFGRGKARD